MDVSLSCLSNVRPPVTIHAPSIWADTFSSYSIQEQVQKKYEEAIEELKQEARNMLMAAETPIKQMKLIDTLERLGLGYHFEQEIEQKLQEIYHHNQDHDDHFDLFTTALRFRLLRQHQHHVSCNVFDKFVDKNGEFESDVEGLLSLYEAAHVRFGDEKILANAERFAWHELSRVESELQSPLKEKVKRALALPLHREVAIFYARRHFISIYEKDESMDERLLKLAKLNFNFLQNLYKNELYELSRWWNKFDLKSKLPYIRDRLTEAYLWGVAYYYQPQYSYVRKGLARCIKMMGVMDDTYDNYATINEAQLLTDAFDRWSMDEDDRIPDYMKIVFRFIMSAYKEYEHDAEKNGKPFAAAYFKETIQQLARAYNKELKWVMEKKMPPFQDYLKNSEITSNIYMMFASIIPGLKSVTQETIDWIKTEPNYVVQAGMLGRYWDDIGSHESESKGGEMLTAVDCYMKQYGVSKQETILKFSEAVEDAWKHVNEGWVVTTSVPKEITVQFVNYSRMCDATYNKSNGDGYTDPRHATTNIKALFVDPIAI